MSPAIPVPTRSAPLVARRTEYRPGFLVLTLTGEIDALTLPILERELRAAPPGTTVVDLTQVAFVGLAGARALAAAAERAGAAGRRFGVVANSRTLARLFRITGLAAVVPMFASLSDALRELLAAEVHDTAC
ncbi:MULTISPECIES: STAS domain-containing protein [unclassified Amycolatopsis]|uniref:STAS domain-containing protein n=1 Tax=unclassified Amycolatopsis TaxID=2618356 RepID=UPI0028743599|nr:MULTISPECIES: STAS domain-containing protein [unclassified Amycolatopsis]MDS0138922.1 STAS domain-containing protein [Amycolatopsis sp. 505]MDS0147594.1 STAS domain-containing protein [Amycolatopsis sp. CM201R]